jgi:hypothetical protein
VTFRPSSRTTRTLLWILFIVLLLIVLSLMFGGFQKGTKALGLGALSHMPAIASAASASAPAMALAGAPATRAPAA